MGKTLIRLDRFETVDEHVVALGHAGAGTSRFRSWTQELPDQVGLWGVLLPGRERRAAEKPIDRLEEVVDLLSDEIDALATEPITLFGHCSGAVVMYELCRSLQAQRRVDISRLIVAGQPAPGSSASRQTPVPETGADVVRLLRELGGTPDELLEEPDFIDLVAPAVKADVTLLRDLDQGRAPQLLTCPIMCLVGMGDDTMGQDGATGWSALTSAGCVVRSLAGDHFLAESWLEVGRLAANGLEATA